MTTVTEDEVDPVVVELRSDTDRLDAAEIELESARATLAATARKARARGMTIPEIERETGYSRGHIYELLGPAVTPRSARRREQRMRRRGGA